MKGGNVLKKILSTIQELARLYSERQIARASAALSYYMTMTIFPLIICLYSLLGHNHGGAVELLEMAEDFLAAETVQAVHSFLDYVAAENSTAMLIAGLTVLISTASAGVRSLQATVGELQGGRRYQGLKDLLFSLLFSVGFLAVMYFSVLVILTGQELLALLSRYVPLVHPDSSWAWLRFLLLAGIELLIFLGIYAICRRRNDRYPVLPGALLATVGTVLMSGAFSIFIGASTRYPLVYGSLASIILLMFWLYLCCQIIYMGAALNIILRNRRRLGREYRSSGGPKK